MHRPRHVARFLLVAVLFSTAGLLLACSGGPEEPVIQQFFQASRLRDNVTLANITMVSFDPREDGQVQSFSVKSISPEQTQPLHIKELAKAHADAKAADDQFTKRKKEFQDKNMEAIDRVIKAESQNQKLKGKDAEVQAAWSKWRDETAEYSKKVSEARTKLAAERRVAEVSVFDPQKPVDVTVMDGDLVSKDYTIDAKVRMPAGQVVAKTLVITLERARLKGEKGQDVIGKWIVTSIKEALAAAPKTS
jgi:Skp family chaperone for outer membrane proteins